MDTELNKIMKIFRKNLPYEEILSIVSSIREIVKWI